jgi:2-amino-4-hydroxy-6-hydroxymethyldihydropteridine diphosphokinase
VLRAVVGLGSNVGDRRAHLRDAVAALRAVAQVERVSRAYESAPVGGPPQGDFLNAAALVAFDGTPRALLDALLGVEAAMGRVRDVRWGPRTIDLDVLWIDGVEVADEGLVVPHPRLLERAFALVPLADVAPGAIDPRSGERLTAPRDHGLRDAGAL